MAKKARTRANNGMGSVRQRKDGLWEARYTSPDGRQRSVYAKTEAEVTRKLRGALHELDTGAWREPSKMPVREWLEIWLDDFQGDNAERTRLKYASIVRSNFVPAVGAVKMSQLSGLHVRRMVSAMQAKGLSQVTVGNYLRVFKAAMERAVEMRIIRENPADNITVSHGQAKKFRVVELSRYREFIAAAEKTKYRNELMFLLLSGLRIGELRGLRWSDIDFDAGSVYIQRQLHPHHIKTAVTPPKYDEVRTMYLSADAVTVLREQRVRQLEARIAAGAGWHDDGISRDLVFRMADGRPVTERVIYSAAKRVGEALGMPDLHPHDLRHSYAVAALRAGVDVKTVQHNLGHKTAGMTLDVYVAYTNEAGKDAAEKLTEYLRSGDI